MISKIKSKGGGLFALPLLMLFAPTPALAQGFLDNVLNQMDAMTGNWMQQGILVALAIFASLAVLEIAWHGIQLVLKKGELSELVAGIVLKVCALGFFYTLITFSSQWLPLISQTFQEAGQRISGSATQITPSGVINTGIAIGRQILETPLPTRSLTDIGGNFLTAILAFFTVVGIIVAFAIIGLQLFVVLVEMKLVMAGGVVMLAMSGSRWSMSFAEKYIGYAVSVGGKFIVIALLTGFGLAFGNYLTDEISGINSSGGDSAMRNSTMLSALATSGIFSVMSFMVPGIAGSMLSGAASMSLSNAAAAGGSIAGAGASMAGRAAGLAAGAAGSALGLIAKLATPAAAAGSIAGMAAGAARGGSAAGSIGGAAKSAFAGSKDGGSVGGNNRPAPSGGGAGGEGASGGSAPSMGQSAESAGGGASSGDSEASAVSDTGSSASAPSMAGGTGDSGASAAADTATPVSSSSGGPATGGTAFPAASGAASAAPAKPAAAQKGTAGGAAKASPAKPSAPAAKSAAPAPASPAVDSSANPATGAQTSKVGTGPIAGLAAPPGMRFTTVDPDAGSRSAMQSQSAGGGGDGYSSGGYSGGGSNGPMDYRDQERAAEKDYRARASSNPFARAMLKASDKLKGASEDASAFARRQRRPMASDGQTGGSPSIRLGMSGD